MTGDPAIRAPDGEPETVARDPLRPFVGRAGERAELASLLDAAGRGRGGLVLVLGEAGIGKSRLLEVVGQDASARGWPVLLGRCWDGGGAPAYWPWIQVVRSAGGDFEALASPRGPANERVSYRSVLDADADRFALFDRIDAFLRSSAGDGPCVVVVDDLHAADEPSLRLLGFLGTTAADRPTLLIGAYRDGEPRVRERADLFADLARLGRRISLRGFAADEVGAYLTLATGATPPSRTVEWLRRLTGGNPFFMGEVVRALGSEGTRAGADASATPRLPEEVRALIRRRVAGLSPEAVSTLRAAAVIGREFDLAVIAAAGALSREQVLDVLDESVRAGVLSEMRESPGSYVFAHDLVRETLYEDLPSSRRMELHRTVGEVLERVVGDDADAHLAEIAHHFTEAAPLGSVDPAVEYSIRAAVRASRMLAFEDAARLYERVLWLLPADAPRDRRFATLLALGDARSRSGDTHGAQQTFEAAAEIARRDGDAEGLARAALGYVMSATPARVGFGGLLITALFPSGTAGVALLEEALRVLPDGDGALRARVLGRLAAELYATNGDERRAVSEESVDMALRLADPEALVAALHGRHWATLTPDSVHERLRNGQELLLAAAAAGDEEAAFLARHARLHCFLELCDVAGVDGELRAMEDLAVRIRQPFYRWHAQSLRGMRALLDGRTAEAERIVRDAFGIARVRASEYVVYMFEYAQLVAIRWVQGRLDEVRERIDEHGDRYRGIARWRDALVAAEVGDVAAARAEIERHARDGFSGLPRGGLWLLHVCALAQAAVLLGDRDRGAELYAMLEPYEDRNAISVSTLPFGPVAWRLGMLATLTEGWDEAERHFERALERCEVLGALAVRARVLIDEAAMFATRGRAGDDERAAAALAEASTIARELDLPAIAERASGARPGAAERPAPATATFRREGEYWTVAFEGATARVRDRKGLRYIAVLLSMPGREVHALELVRATEAAGSVAGVPHDGSGDGGDAPVLDEAAKRAYRDRLRDLSEDLEEARGWNDPERVAKIEDEIEALTTELGRSLGLHGHARRFASPAERARVSVTKSIRAAVREIGQACPALGRHLDASIRTGRFCSYAPPGREPPSWSV